MGIPGRQAAGRPRRPAGGGSAHLRWKGPALGGRLPLQGADAGSGFRKCRADRCCRAARQGGGMFCSVRRSLGGAAPRMPRRAPNVGLRGCWRRRCSARRGGSWLQEAVLFVRSFACPLPPPRGGGPLLERKSGGRNPESGATAAERPQAEPPAGGRARRVRCNPVPLRRQAWAAGGGARQDGRRAACSRPLRGRGAILTSTIVKCRMRHQQCRVQCVTKMSPPAPTSPQPSAPSPQPPARSCHNPLPQRRCRRQPCTCGRAASARAVQTLNRPVHQDRSQLHVVRPRRRLDYTPPCPGCKLSPSRGLTRAAGQRVCSWVSGSTHESRRPEPTLLLLLLPLWRQLAATPPIGAPIYRVP
jgi:hypothetical protein